MDSVIEHVDIKYNVDLFRSIFEQTTASNPLNYLECGAQSWTLEANPEYKELWGSILEKHSLVHPKFCKLATGFNYSRTNNHTVPPHIDIDKPSYFNLLIPVYGVARIDIFETKQEDLEFRHGLTHWMMLKKGSGAQKVGELLVDRPTLLNTNHLHSVNPTDSPRCVWCTRWIDLPKDLEFKTFKEKIEDVLNA